jgi:DNA replication protein DnaC
MAADINSAPVIVDQEDAARRMNDRLDEVIPKRYRRPVPMLPAVEAWVEEYAQDPTTARSLLIMGPTGTGKTHAAYGALRAAAVRALRPNRAGRYILGTWMSTTFPDFMASMRPGQFQTGDALTSQKYMMSLRETPLLVVDDLGMCRENPFVEECTHRLISGRYDEERPTIYTTNLDAVGLADGVGGRIASRLMQECLIVAMKGQDRRLG